MTALHETPKALIMDAEPDARGILRGHIRSTVDGHHLVSVDCHTGHVTCTCRDFTFRKAHHLPTIGAGDNYLCKHLRVGRIEIRKMVMASGLYKSSFERPEPKATIPDFDPYE